MVTSQTPLRKEKIYELEPAITHRKIRKVLHDVKNNKSPGSDKIPVKLLKESGDKGIEILTSLCKKIWETGKWLDDWKRSEYIPIPKKGDARECANYRTIALITHASKIFLKVIQGRMEQ